MNTLVLIILQQKQLTEPFLTSNLALLQSYGPGRYYLFWYPSILGLKPDQRRGRLLQVPT